jgi:fructoselysine-6-P-deglycase FrlB-like protein
VDPKGFLADLERKPDVLGALADVVDSGAWVPALPVDVDRVLLVGMGSSTYAAGVAAARMRARGLAAVADLASSHLLPPPHARLLVVAISASGGSRETLDAVAPHGGRSRVVALTNVLGSPVTGPAEAVWPMLAEPETGGVACRSYQHTLIALIALEARLAGLDSDLGTVVRSAAEASADLLDRRADWLPDVAEALAGPSATALVAPAHRLGSAQQSALMVREGPRRPAIACETGDWSHVDVYLTKTQDYRMLLFPGSRYEDELLRWTQERGSTVVTVGADCPGGAGAVRYRHDDDDDVRLLTEVLVAELVAQSWWAAG